ncbi:MAG: ATP-binding protein [Candidatus Nanoarchaeia archaeon]
MRDELKNKILTELLNNKNILLTGPFGIGKTTLAKEVLAEFSQKDPKKLLLYHPFPKPQKQIFYRIFELFTSKGFNIPVNWKALSMYSLCELIIKILEKEDRTLFLFLDEAQLITDISIQLYSYLLNSGKVHFVLIGDWPAIQKKVLSANYALFFWKFEQIKVEPLNNQEAKELLENYLKVQQKILDESTKAKILSWASGNPMEILRATDRALVGEEPNLNLSLNSINLFPLFIFAIFVLIGLKYLYRGIGDYALANFSGFVGIVLFFIIRYLWYNWKNF